MTRHDRIARGLVGLGLAAGLAGCVADMAEEEDLEPREDIAAGLPAQLLLEDPATVEEFELAATGGWSEYAGLWVEGAESGRPVIHIARTGDLFEPEWDAIDAPVVYVDAAHSLRELNRELAQVLEADRADDSIAFGAYVDPRRNRVVVEPELAAPEVLTDPDEVARRLGADPEMIIVDKPIRMHTTAVAGGYAAGGCTGGFPVKKANGSGGYDYGLLTAGHCSDSPVTSAGCTFYGATYSSVTATGVDRQIHRRNQGQCSPSRRLSNGVYFHSGTSSGYTGQPIRRIGMTTGTRSGTIYILNWYYAGVDGPWILSSTSLDCRGGDSGGPWYTSTGWPLGITRGTTGERCFASKISKALGGTGWGIL